MQHDFQPQFRYQRSLTSEIITLDTFIIPKIIKNFYYIFLFCIAFVGAITIFSGMFSVFNGEFVNGAMIIAIGVVGTLAVWFVLRLSMEIIMLAFKNNEYLKKNSRK